MARLYYEKKYDPTQSAALTEEGRDFNDYLEKVSKLIPSEIIAGYLTMIGLADAIGENTSRDVSIWVVFSIGLVLTPLYLNKVAEKDKPKRNHLILSTVAFLVWAYVITGEKLLDAIWPDQNFYNAALASIILIAFSLISAVIPLDR